MGRRGGLLGLMGLGLGRGFALVRFERFGQGIIAVCLGV